MSSGSEISDDLDNVSIASEDSFGDWGYVAFNEPPVRDASLQNLHQNHNHKRNYSNTSSTSASSSSSTKHVAKKSTNTKLKIQHVDYAMARGRQPMRPSPIAEIPASLRDSDLGKLFPNPYAASAPPKPKHTGYREWEDEVYQYEVAPAIEAAVLCTRYGHQMSSPATIESKGVSSLFNKMGKKQCRRCGRKVYRA